MFDYLNLYNSMENPLTDETIIYLINSMSTGEIIYKALYTKFVNQDTTETYNIASGDNLYSYLFSEWKYNVLKLSNEGIAYLANIGVIAEDFNELKSVLNSYPKINSKSEYENLLKKEYLIKKYNFTNYSNTSDFVHIRSSILNIWNEKEIATTHNLYLNFNKNDVEKVVLLFIKECQRRNLPFHIKFDVSKDRDDPIVIYSDTQHLEEYIYVLKNIRLYNKELFSKIKEPPILTGKIYDWLGYGSKSNYSNKMSFYVIRGSIIENSITTALNNWIYENRGLTIQVGDKKVLFYEYLSNSIASVVIKKIKKIMKEYEANKNLKEFYEIYHLSKEELYSSELKEILSQGIKKEIINFIVPAYKKTYINDVKVRFKLGKMITVTRNDYNKTTLYIMKEILKNYPDFADKVTELIKQEAKDKNIDINKFCFDNNVKEELFEHYKKSCSKK